MENLLLLFLLLAGLPVLSGLFPSPPGRRHNQGTVRPECLPGLGSFVLPGDSRAEGSGRIPFTWELIPPSCHAVPFSESVNPVASDPVSGGL